MITDLRAREVNQMKRQLQSLMKEQRKNEHFSKTPRTKQPVFLRIVKGCTKHENVSLMKASGVTAGCLFFYPSG